MHIQDPFQFAKKVQETMSPYTEEKTRVDPSPSHENAAVITLDNSYKKVITLIEEKGSEWQVTTTLYEGSDRLSEHVSHYPKDSPELAIQSVESIMRAVS